MIDGFVITYNEEEMLPYCLASWEHILPVLGCLSIVDNGSTDSTLDIIHQWRDRLPIMLTHYHRDRHHGHLRNAALEILSASWVMYLDADETWTNDMLPWLQSGEHEQADQWEFYKYSTIQDREHTAAGGNGPSRRFFRFQKGVGFPQEIHTEPTGPGLSRLTGRGEAQGPWLFDHTGCKSDEALWAKGWRYQWAAGVPGIGPTHEYIGRVATAYAQQTVVRIPDRVVEHIFTGPQ